MAWRGLIVPPHLRVGGGGEERHATWLELFYDLVFVAAVSQVARRLEVRVSPTAALSYAVLFIPVWWTWVGAVFYENRFGSDDLIERLLTFLQIAVATALAVTVGTVYSRDGGIGFPLAYAAIRLILVAEYVRARHYALDARPVTTRYALGFGIAAAFWGASVLLEPPGRYVLWGLGLVVDFATPLTAGQLHARFAPHGTHLPERFGQFNLIVLGAAITAVVTALGEFRWNLPGAVTAILSLLLAFGFWWLYFDTLDASVIEAAREQGRIGPYQVWLYAHLPLAAGIAAAGVGAEYAIRSAMEPTMHVGERWLLCASVATVYVALAAINFARAATGCANCTYARALHCVFGASAAIVVALIGGYLVPAAIVGLLSAVALLQVTAVIRTSVHAPT